LINTLDAHAFPLTPHTIVQTIQPPPHFSDEDLPTVEAVVAQKRREAEARSQKAAVPESKTVPEPETTALATEVSSEAPAKDVETNGQAPPETGGPEALEEEAAQQGAFNPETGEINWDCPCLGGMADGPCGEEFKAAFSCFVYSKEEPKGMDCIDKFQYVLAL
jgi:intermembrane space import and assembly protein 40